VVTASIFSQRNIARGLRSPRVVEISYLETARADDFCLR